MHSTFHESGEGDVKGDKVEATFDKGILTVTLPKIEEAKKRN